MSVLVEEEEELVFGLRGQSARLSCRMKVQMSR
jgi:hypothetical protein